MIELQPFTKQDCDRLIRWVPSAKFMLQWAGPAYDWPLDERQLLNTYAKTKDLPPVYYMFKAYEPELGQNVGHIELMNVDIEKASAHIGRVIVDPSIRGKGYGIQLMNRICECAFTDLQLSLLTLGVFDFNQSAIACYQKVGFQVTETKIGFREFEDEKWNLVMMKLEKHEWESNNAMQTDARTSRR